jgi:hypothetical protein
LVAIDERCLQESKEYRSKSRRGPPFGGEVLLRHLAALLCRLVAIWRKIGDNAQFGRDCAPCCHKRLLLCGIARYNRRLSPPSTTFWN